jgi:hypothetical protein
MCVVSDPSPPDDPTGRLSRAVVADLSDHLRDHNAGVDEPSPRCHTELREVSKATGELPAQRSSTSRGAELPHRGRSNCGTAGCRATPGAARPHRHSLALPGTPQQAADHSAEAGAARAAARRASGPQTLPLPTATCRFPSVRGQHEPDGHLAPRSKGRSHARVSGLDSRAGDFDAIQLTTRCGFQVPPVEAVAWRAETKRIATTLGSDGIDRMHSRRGWPLHWTPNGLSFRPVG